MYGNVALRSVPLSCARGTRQRHTSEARSDAAVKPRLERLAVADVAAPAQHVRIDEFDDGRCAQRLRAERWRALHCTSLSAAVRALCSSPCLVLSSVQVQQQKLGLPLRTLQRFQVGALQEARVLSPVRLSELARERSCRSHGVLGDRAVGGESQQARPPRPKQRRQGERDDALQRLVTATPQPRAKHVRSAPARTDVPNPTTLPTRTPTKRSTGRSMASGEATRSKRHLGVDAHECALC